VAYSAKGMGGKQRKDCAILRLFDMMVGFCYHVPMRMGKVSVALLARLRKSQYERRLYCSVVLRT
jgi:hypothetical protein